MSAELFLKKFFKPYQDNIYQSIFTFTYEVQTISPNFIQRYV